MKRGDALNSTHIYFTIRARGNIWDLPHYLNHFLRAQSSERGWTQKSQLPGLTEKANTRVSSLCRPFPGRTETTAPSEVPGTRRVRVFGQDGERDVPAPDVVADQLHLYRLVEEIRHRQHLFDRRLVRAEPGVEFTLATGIHPVQASRRRRL